MVLAIDVLCLPNKFTNPLLEFNNFSSMSEKLLPIFMIFLNSTYNVFI